MNYDVTGRLPTEWGSYLWGAVVNPIIGRVPRAYTGSVKIAEEEVRRIRISNALERRKIAKILQVQRFWKATVSRMTQAVDATDATLIRMSLCRPAGVWTDPYLPHTCRKWRLCPFCYYRQLESFMQSVHMRSDREMKLATTVAVFRAQDTVLPTKPDVAAMAAFLRNKCRGSKIVCGKGLKFFKKTADGRWAMVMFFAALTLDDSRLPKLGGWKIQPASREALGQEVRRWCSYPWQLMLRETTPDTLAGLYGLSLLMRDTTRGFRRQGKATIITLEEKKEEKIEPAVFS